MRWSSLAALCVLVAPLSARAAAPEGHDGTISGVVRHQETEERIEGALVVLQCACLSGPRETQTNSSGLYRFSGLPAGTYTVQVLVGQAVVSKVVTLAPRRP